ncbi:hypothetical protein HMPREF9073_02506 [Capnocytophaga sp. oral taxon 326 str. F0382]|nr:hypothetical protein HMPREF9073_02506 [Capnocytophaga sp. oral taxon 326 str. F0382]
MSRGQSVSYYKKNLYYFFWGQSNYIFCKYLVYFSSMLEIFRTFAEKIFLYV